MCRGTKQHCFICFVKLERIPLEKKEKSYATASLLCSNEMCGRIEVTFLLTSLDRYLFNLMHEVTWQFVGTIVSEITKGVNLFLVIFHAPILKLDGAFFYTLAQ